MTGGTDDYNAQTLAKVWLVWVAVSAVGIAVGLGVKTILWPGIGESIVVFGLLSFLASITTLIYLITALSRQWQFAVFGLFGIMVVVLGAILYRYVPYAFGILVRFAVMAGSAFGGIGVLKLVEVVLERIMAGSEGEA